MITLYTGDNYESKTIKIVLEEKHIEFKEKQIKTTTENELKQLATEIRSIRPKLTQYGPENRWDFNELILSPILKTEFGTFPWWHLRTNLNQVITEIKATQKPEKKKLKIRRITRNQNSQSICLTANALGRINVTILRALHGANIVDLVNSWSLEERTAFVIAWRLCQHQKRNELHIFADMLENKAKTSDPYAEKNNEWIGAI